MSEEGKPSLSSSAKSSPPAITTTPPPDRDNGVVGAAKVNKGLFPKIDLEAAKGTLENIKQQEEAFEKLEQQHGADGTKNLMADPSLFKRPLSARGSPTMDALHQANIYRKAKKPAIRGPLIEEGSLGWETMCDMLTGIRVVCSVKDYRSVKLTQGDFQTTRTLNCPRRGSKYTPPHSQRSFQFKDYAPMVFARIREKFGLDPADYLDSLTRDTKMTCIRSPGKSASMFFYSYDGRFMVKTINQEESTYLMQILPAYYDHINSNPDTLVTRFYGLHKVRPKKEKSAYIVIMANVLNSTYFDMDEIYDLKGSTVGRTAEADEKKKKDEKKEGSPSVAPASSPAPDSSIPKKLDPAKIYKDLDFTRGFCFGPNKAKFLFDQMASDLKFLEDNNIMDYSLLVGVHELTESDLFSRPDRPHGPVTPRRAVENAGQIPSLFTHDWGGYCASDERDKPGTAIYFMGIIDILQSYNLRKQLEHGIKSFQYEADQISCVDPKLFASRFLKYMREKQKIIPASEMRTLKDLQQSASTQEVEEPQFGMLTPRRQYHRQLQLELEGVIPSKDRPARMPQSPRYSSPNYNTNISTASTNTDDSSSDDPSDSSEEDISSSNTSDQSPIHRPKNRLSTTNPSVSTGSSQPRASSPLARSSPTKPEKHKHKHKHKHHNSEKSDKSDQSPDVSSASSSAAHSSSSHPQDKK